MAPILHNPTQLELPPCIGVLFPLLYATYDEVTILRAFTSGRSTSLVYLVRPIRNNNQGALANVVKIDVAEQIRAETNAYRHHIEGRLPSSARLIEEPAYSPDNLWGGMRFELVGNGFFDILSLGEYAHQVEPEKIYTLFENRLLPILGALWKAHHLQAELQPGIAYDTLLPANLILEPVHHSDDIVPFTPTSTLVQKLVPGMCLQISGFEVVKRNPRRGSLSMNLPNSSYRSSFQFKVYAPNVVDYHPGEIVNFPYPLVIRESRLSLMNKYVQAAMGANFNLVSNTIHHPTGRQLPNPLAELPQLLQWTFDAYVATVHGDLNLQNVLVDKSIGNAFVIDFAHSRTDHVLRDLLHMEMYIVNHLLADALATEMLAAPYIVTIYRSLHNAIVYGQALHLPTAIEKPVMMLHMLREAAREYMYEKQSWREYYAGLTIYLMGSLRFADLDERFASPLPKQLAFWGAATLLDLMREEAEVNKTKTIAPKPRQVRNDQVDTTKYQPLEGKMSKTEETQPKLTTAECQNALVKILNIASQRSAQLLMYGSCLGAIALIPTNSVPQMLIALSSTAGVNILASLIERVARNKEISDDKIEAELERAIVESNFENIIANNKSILTEVRQLVVWQEQIKFVVQTGNKEIIELLLEYETSFTELRFEFEALSADIRRLYKALSTQGELDGSAKGTGRGANQSIETGNVKGKNINITGHEQNGNDSTNENSITSIKIKDIEASDTVNITGKKTMGRN